MNGRSQMQGGKNWILAKELSLVGNLGKKSLISLSGTAEWRERDYGLRRRVGDLTESAA